MDESAPRSRHPDPIGQVVLRVLLPTLLLILHAPDATYAQVVTNITPTTGTSLDLGTNVDTVGSSTEITGGTRPGNGTNLFHSFDAFSLGTGDTAHFLNDMQLPTTNIFGRVIGGEVSEIDGTLRTNNPFNAADPMNFGTANLWLVNPSGLLLGPNARLDVGGSVSMSTANYLRFEGTSTLFDMLSSPASLGPLSVAPVAAFGFLGSNPVLNATQSTLSVQGGTVQGSKTLTLVGRDATVGGTATPGIILSGGTLSNSDGRINLVSVGLPQDLVKGAEIQVTSLTSAPAASGHPFNTMGEIKLSGASLDTSGTTGGGIVIHGGQLTIDNGRISASKTGITSDSPTGIDIKLDGTFALNLTEQILALDTQTFGAGDGGDVKIAASKVILNFSGEEGSAPTVIAAGGNVVITATGDVNLNRVGVFNEAAPGPGNVGSIVIKGANVTVTNSFIGSEAAFTTRNPSALEIEATTSVKLIGPSFISSISGSGQLAGNVTIAAKNLLMEGNAVITAHTQGAGNAGNIIIKADNLVMGSESPLSPPSIRNDSNEGATGNAGSIDLSVGRLTMNPHSSLTSVSAGGGNAGNVKVHGLGGKGTAANVIKLDSSTISTEISGGNAASTPSAITITAQTLALAGNAQIRADTRGAASAGDIALNVGTLTAGNSTIFSDSFFNDSKAGSAGSITIQGITDSGSPAANVSLDNSPISTTIAGGTSASVPANITIGAQAITLSNGGAITASTKGNAPAGNIGLVTQQLTMTPDSAITSNAQDGGVATTGKAGSITITGAGSAPTTITGGTIQAQSETSAIAGNITLHAPEDLTLLGTTVSVQSTGSGDAGSIDVRAGNNLLVRNSQVSTESVQASGGDIKLTAPNLIHIIDSTINSSVQGQAGSNGGNINIDPQWVVIQNSQLLANANAGAGGNITITATGAVLVDPNSRIDASAGPAGVSGSVNINSPIQVLGGILVPLKLAYSQAELSSDRCASDPTGQFSSFVQTGRDGVPQIPGALSPSPLSFLESLTSGSLGSPSPNWAAARLGLDSVSDPSLFRFHSACRS